FFPSMDPLLSRVPIYPVLGNHEQDARHYYDYMQLPDPEYYYDFEYGNAHFFMLDTNRKVHPGSEQFVWLEKELKKSKAIWKIVCHHHPAFSSDENDYGDMWKGPSSHGDLRVRELTALYDKYDVDLVWNGHIHSYERTWPLAKGKVVEENGTTYMITGGGGGGLETPGPIRPWFQNNVRRGHHWCYVAVNGGTLEMKAFDLEGRMFDVLTLKKPG
ncbi:MAG: metallophosphoesterase, partial [Planctomycetota bacterium]|nr:metallophosphoesterase [Planctomycetota bacterium]